MEKLLNLLQEFYGENRKFSNENGLLTMTNGVENLSGAYAQTYIISLKGGFVKWLVDNDKIDFYTILKENGTFRKEFYAIENRKEYERLIMLLSVEDEPIRFLCEILK